MMTLKWLFTSFSRTELNLLYNRHRPKFIRDLVGQDAIKQFLYSINLQNYPKVVIFHGPSGAGKTTAVRLFMRKLWYPDTEGKDISPDAPDNANEFDYIELSGVEKSGVDDMRQLKELAQLSSLGGKPRIFVIDEAHGLSSKAFDALLKVTEESTSNVFAFVTTEFSKIPKTIKTRALDFRFAEPDMHELRDYIQVVSEREGYTLEDELAGVMSFKSDNSYRSALTVLEKVMPHLKKGVVNSVKDVPAGVDLLSEEETNSMKSFPGLLRRQDFRGILGLLKPFGNNEAEIRNFCYYMYNYTRKVFDSGKTPSPSLASFLLEIGSLLADYRMPVNRIAVEVAILRVLTGTSR